MLDIRMPAGAGMAYYLYLQMDGSIRIMLSALLFLIPLKKKSRWVIAAALAVFSCVVISVALAWLRFICDTLPIRFLAGLCRYAFPLLIILSASTGDLVSRLRVSCAAVAASEAANNTYFLLLQLCGGNEMKSISFLHAAGRTTFGDWVIYLAVNLGLIYLLFRLFRYDRYEELDEGSRKGTALLTCLCLLFLPLADCFRFLQLSTGVSFLLLYRIHIISVSLFFLTFCTEISFHSRARTEKRIMDQVLSEERKRYFQLKENIDLINIRCHDLRHHLDDFSGRLTEKEIEELREAMEFYDSNLKTGNEVLDVVLRINQLACQKENIQLSCLADGTALGFMRRRDIYTLLNNALSNALEAVRKLEDTEKRVISLGITRKGQQVEIELTNYFDGTMTGSGATTKEDTHHHGFGILSMRYIAEEYGGCISIQAQKDIFTLMIVIPIPKS